MLLFLIMTLGTHAAVGAVVAGLVPTNPVLGLGLAFTSHFVLDMIPHWDYQLASAARDEVDALNDDIIVGQAFIYDLAKIGTDFALGLLGALIILASFYDWTVWTWVIMGAIGGALPDALQFVYFKWRREPLVSLQRFHQWVHTTIRLDGRPILGASLQVLLAGVVLGVYVLLH
ncbi:MAG: hypothetical protein HYV76_02320 [Candidatus Vogelbacteria bacterium]|nr:hypothetical protein [Candidatus Vogelbacteria bacterium]